MPGDEQRLGRDPLDQLLRTPTWRERLLLDRDRLVVWGCGALVLAVGIWVVVQPGSEDAALPMTSTTTAGDRTSTTAGSSSPPSREASGPSTSSGSAGTSGSSGDTGGSTTDDTGGASADGSGGSAAEVAVVVHVAGAVRRPGLVELAGGARVADAVDAAGGLDDRADINRINLARPLTDGERVLVLAVGDPDPPGGWNGPSTVITAPTGGVGASGSTSAGAGGQAGVTATGLVDINSADEAALDTLPGVGPATATAIVEFRDANGPFLAVEELLDVPGIGPAKLSQLADKVTVGSGDAR